MRNLRLLDAYRRPDMERKHYGVEGGDTEGMFFVPGPPGANQRTLRIIASSGEGWDHVSVSLPDRTPHWAEMEHVKRLFFQDDECAMQLHVPPSDHISHHPYCLHIWRPLEAAIPRPPSVFVA